MDAAAVLGGCRPARLRARKQRGCRQATPGSSTPALPFDPQRRAPQRRGPTAKYCPHSNSDCPCLCPCPAPASGTRLPAHLRVFPPLNNSSASGSAAASFTPS